MPRDSMPFEGTHVFFCDDSRKKEPACGSIAKRAPRNTSQSNKEKLNRNIARAPCGNCVPRALVSPFYT